MRSNKTTMNIERAITFFAIILMAAIVIMYTAWPQNTLSNFAFQTDTNSTASNLDVAHEQATVGKIADLQALATYQATLPFYKVGRDSVVKEGHKTIEQIAD